MSNADLLWDPECLGPQWAPIESGTYAYERCPAGGRDFVPTSVVERYIIWSHQNSRQKLIRTTRDARSMPDGVELRVESWVDGETTSRVQLEVRDKDENPLTKVQYQLGGGWLYWRKAGVDNDNWLTTRTLHLPRGAILLPLMRNYLGAVIFQTAGRANGKAPIVVPELADPRASTVFTPTVAMREATRVSEISEPMTLAERIWDCQAYRFVGGPYGPDSTFWICEDSGRLIRYMFEAKTGERWLTKLVRFATNQLGRENVPALLSRSTATSRLR